MFDEHAKDRGTWHIQETSLEHGNKKKQNSTYEH
jgi:hypothetical protein